MSQRCQFRTHGPQQRNAAQKSAQCLPASETTPEVKNQSGSLVDSNRQQGNLSSAIRLFVLDYFKSRAEAAASDSKPPS